MNENNNTSHILTILATIFVTISLSALSLDAGTHIWSKTLQATGDGRLACVIGMLAAVIGLFLASFVAFVITYVSYKLSHRYTFAA